MPLANGIAQETTQASSGTGNLDLVDLGDFREFTDEYTTGGTDVFYYFIRDKENADMEYGTGHLVDSSTLARDTVEWSTNSNSLVNFLANTQLVTQEPAEDSSGFLRMTKTKFEDDIADDQSNTIYDYTNQTIGDGLVDTGATSFTDQQLTTNDSPTFNSCTINDDLVAQEINKIRNAEKFNTIQDAIDDLTNHNTLGVDIGSVFIPAKDNDWNETFDVDIQGSIVEGQGINTRIVGTGDHTITITSSDTTIRNLWIDQTDSSGNNYDAINIRADETRIENCDIDDAPRTGLNLSGYSRCTVVNTQFVTNAGEDLSAISDGSSTATQNAFTNIIIEGVPRDGFSLQGQHSSLSNINIKNTTRHGLLNFSGSNDNRIDAVINSSGDKGCIINGNRNICNLQIKNSTNADLEVDGNNNIIFLDAGGDVTLTGNSSGNVIIGRIAGTLTDSGSNNTHRSFTDSDAYKAKNILFQDQGSTGSQWQINEESSFGNFVFKNGGTTLFEMRSDGSFDLNGLPTEGLEILDAGSTSATEQDWVEVEVGGNTGYLRVFSSK